MLGVEDLFYRLMRYDQVLPLRDRRSDIPLLIQYLLKKINADLHHSIKRVEGRAMERLSEYHRPGNVRELENILTRGDSTPGEVILDEFIVTSLKRPMPSKRREGRADRHDDPAGRGEGPHPSAVLQHTCGISAAPGGILGISRPTLRQKFKGVHITLPPDHPDHRWQLVRN